MKIYMLDELRMILKKHNMKKQDTKKVIRSFKMANKLHSGTLRESGERYITHPFAVSKILLEEMKTNDPIAICAADLHDTKEDCGMTDEQITRKFGKAVAFLVDGLTKIHKLKFTSVMEAEQVNLRNFLVKGIMQDVRIILIKLADRLHNMRTINYKKEEYKRLENANETYIYIDLAHWLGMENIRRKLEFIAFSVLHPEKVKLIGQNLKLYLNSRKEKISTLIEDLFHKIKKQNIDASIKFFVKPIPQIDSNLNQGLTFEEIHNLKQIRIVTKDVSSCYKIFAMLAEQYPIFSHNGKCYDKDYIEDPKPNLYQALHRTIIGPNNDLFQVQIMTKEMADINELGIAYYWNNPAKMQEIFNNKFEFFKQILENNIISLSDDSKIHTDDKYANSIKVYNKSGEIIFLPIGSSVLDFIYSCIRDDWAIYVTSAKINGIERALTYPLKTDDEIELIFSKDITTPTKGDIAYCVTSVAKKGIKKYLDGQNIKSLTNNR